MHLFWGRRPYGVAIKETLLVVYTLESELSTDRDEGFLEEKEADANERHKKIDQLRSGQLLQSRKLQFNNTNHKTDKNWARLFFQI